MMKQLILAASLCGLTVVLSGCGGGGGGGSTPGPGVPTPAPGPTVAPPPPAGDCDCPKSQNFIQCTACHSDGTAISCKTCKGIYKPNNAATDRTDPEQVCVAKCDPAPAPPPRPGNAQQYNGVKWPTQCQDQYTEAVFFAIGDWGGMCGFAGKLCHCGAPNTATCTKGGNGDDCAWKYKDASPSGPCAFPPHGPPKNVQVEGGIQQRIAGLMNTRNDALTTAGTPPQFVLNVGDNFYPGGVDVHCGAMNVDDHTKKQFEYVWKDVYKGASGNIEMEWWSVLGNHDYGGVCYTKGWDQQILYTWEQDSKWMMPGQYWTRSAQYKNMKIDFFFVDGSWLDTKDGGGGVAANHDICQYQTKATHVDKICDAGPTCGSTGPVNGGDCENWFKTLQAGQFEWLMKMVTASDADAQYQIVVTHYPAAKSLGHAGHDQVNWIQWAPKFGVELVISGHKHFQRVYQGVIPGQGGPTHGTITGVDEDWSQGTTSIITGGGGGIISDNVQNAQPDGQDDAYGFFEFHATLEKIVLTAYSHGGLQKKLIVRNTTIIYPMRAAPVDEIIKAGLDPTNLLRKREITV